MSKKFFKMWPIIGLCLIIWALPTFGQQVEKERAEFKSLMQVNPNYFGTFPQLPFKPIKPMILNLKYESLNCLGFYPKDNRLEAIIGIKLPFGYGGNLCGPGSQEYVRFFVDWNNDGDYLDVGEDAGVSGVNVHDIPNIPYPCLTTSKPLSYSVSLVVKPPKYSCPAPYLVKVKAILAWNHEPTAGNPNYHPVWGNVLEKWIQIDPWPIFFIQPDIALMTMEDLKKAEMELKTIEPEEYKALVSEELQALYKGKMVSEMRFDLPKVVEMAAKIKAQPRLKAEFAKKPEFAKYMKLVDFVVFPKPNVEYEQLTCVGIDYSQSQLKATLIVKRPYGYSGELCKTKGSYEYVAFWAYVKKPLSRVCTWQYCGTSKVNVHDIPGIPPEGLHYAVYKSVDFSSWQDKCEKPVILKVRGKLSWNQEPPTDNPDWLPVYGNTVDAYVQIKPGPKIEPNEQKPFIWSIGRMPVESIDGNVYTTLHSSLGDGYANGPCSGPGGYTAIESPFGARMTISGSISNAPDNPTEMQKLLYKLQYRKSGAAPWNTIANSFWIWIRKNSVPSGYIVQTPDSNGFYKFQKDIGPFSPTVEVQEDVLGYLYTPVFEGDGLYEIRMVMKNPTTLVEMPSEIIKVMIDNTAPEVDLTLTSGACSLFHKGDLISGTFKATDKHFYYYALTLEPYAPSPGTSFWHKPLAAGPIFNYSTNPTYPALAAPGASNGSFELNTATATTVVQCGYIFKVHVWDRTIVNDHLSGHYNARSVGFCLLNK